MREKNRTSPCEACTKASCCGHHKCEIWREWFGTRWQVIRYTAGEMKARRLLANAVLPPEGQQDA